MFLYDILDNDKSDPGALDFLFAVSTVSCMTLSSAAKMFSLQTCSMRINAHCRPQ
jgi:hypothetical protein